MNYTPQSANANWLLAIWLDYQMRVNAPLEGCDPVKVPAGSVRDALAEVRLCRTLLADAAALLKDKLTPDTGQLRTQWDRDVDEWLVVAAPLFAEAEER